MASEIRWLPLESNPEVMNKYVWAMGVPRPWQFTDVYGFDPELLAFVPRPVAAVLLLYPLNDKTSGSDLGQTDPGNKDIYFMKQSIGNACGTIGLIHALGNNKERIGLGDDAPLLKFFDSTKSATPEERAKKLENEKLISDIHEETAQLGQTTAPGRDEKINLHFIAFVHNNGGLYELDGRKDAPVKHGNTSENTLLEDTVEVVKKFMARDPENLNFTVVALTQGGQD